MGLLDVILPKKYKNSKVLFEQNLDDWRNTTEQAFATVNKNLTQVALDAFGTGYNFNNSGLGTLSAFLQQQINNISVGVTPLSGTSNETFEIHAGANSSTITTGSLTAPRVHTLPDVSGDFVVTEGSQTINGNKTFSGTTSTAKIIASQNSIIPMLVTGQVQNLSWSKSSAGVITIASADGSALSSTNVGYVCMPSILSYGSFVTLKVTSNVTFNDDDHASSNLTGWKFGVTSGVAWNDFIPISIYALNKDDTDAGLVFGISIDPRANSFSTANIGDKDAVPASDTQNSIFIAASITESDYNGKPAMKIGATIMKKVAAADDWTLHSAMNLGFGRFAIDYVSSRIHTMVLGQNGAKASNFINSSGGQIPTWAVPSNITYYWTLGENGVVEIAFNTSNAGNCSQDGGAGSDVVSIYLPLQATLIYGINNNFIGTGEFVLGGASVQLGGIEITSGSYVAPLYYYNGSNLVLVPENNFSDVTDDLKLTATYKAF